MLLSSCYPAAPAPPKAAGPMSQMMLDLQVVRAEQVRLHMQVNKLKGQLGEAQAEMGRLKDQLLYQQ